jgi:hypothetical protein
VNLDPRRSRASRAAAIGVVIAALLALVGLAPAAGDDDQSDAAELPALADPAPPEAAAGDALPTRRGSVTVDTDARLALDDATSAAVDAAAAASTRKVAVRALVVALDENDFGLATWRATLDRVGATYDVVHASSTPLTTGSLVGADGTGRYNAILLTDAMLLHQDESGGFASGLSAEEWNLLWAYERDFAVRQATLYASYGSWPEDYCLRAGTEGGVGDTPLNISLTGAGASVFDYLEPGAQIPITQSYVYRDTLATDCAATPILTAGNNVLGVQTTSTDGRERMALTFTSNQHLVQSHLLTYGLFRWASKGLYFGEQRHFLKVDVDDWFNASDHQHADGTIDSDPGFRMSGHDAYNADVQQKALRSRHPLASQFKLTAAFNGGEADLSAPRRCYPDGGIEQLTATSRCLRGAFEWINHTATHAKMNFTDYATSLTEVTQNLVYAAALGLPTSPQVLKTGEYSGLGVYHPDPNNDIDPPTDHGLGASNPNLLAAAKAAGVRYLHGNMSFPSHQPSCFNCGIWHPLEPTLLVVPDWPTNIAYFSTTPEEQTYFYNSYYGPNGKFPFWPVDQSYDQIVEHEAGQAFTHLATGSIYTHTLHIGNLRDFGSGRTLTTDWLESVLAKYSAYYSVPLLTPSWQALGTYVGRRNEHFTELGEGVHAVYDGSTGQVTVTSPTGGRVTMTGARTSGFTEYGSEVSASINLRRDRSVVFTPALRS